MLTLINNYSLTVEPTAPQYQTLDIVKMEEGSPYAISITLRSSIFEDQNNINAKQLETLSHIEVLEKNWDTEGAVPPSSNVIAFAKAIIYIMNAIGQEIYNIAPGPDGEIMLLFSNASKSFEVLIYPDKMRYVKFPESGVPIQGAFTIETLYSDLLSWLNS